VSETAHFDIHASIVFQLGEQLVSDDVQAVLELAKNAYDADATYINMEVHSDKPPPQDSRFADTDAKGYILLEDNGSGMTRETLVRGWLVISNSIKRDQKLRQETTQRGRTPLGDKGLGRLSAQRLGYNIEIFTRSAHEDVEHYIGFSWREFGTVERLTDVPVRLESRKAVRPPGTRVMISDLRHPEVFTQRADALRIALSKLVSPFRNIEDFKFLVTVDGARLNLAEIGPQIRDLAHVHYAIVYRDNMLMVHGYARLELLRPSPGEGAQFFEDYVARDDGNQFFTFLQTRKGFDALKVKRSEKSPWFFEFQLDVSRDDIPSVTSSDPGPFTSEVDYFNLRKDALEGESAFDSQADLRAYIKDLSGIRVYRDGFGIRVDQDWLGLAAAWTSGSSFYELRPTNVLGYVALSAASNGALQETTDRQGFEDTAAFRSFFAIMKRFVKFTADAQEFLRRSFNEYRKNIEAREAALSPVESATPQSVARHIKNKIKRVNRLQETMQSTRTALQSAVTTAADSTKAIDTPLLQDPKLVEKTRVDLESVNKALIEYRAVLDSLEGDLDEVAKLEHATSLLELQLETMRQQAALMHETVGLGLVAEALSHEVRHVAQRLLSQSKDFGAHLRRVKSADRQALVFVEYVNSAGHALNHQVSYLSPIMRYQRERKSAFDVLERVKGTTGFFESRFASKSVDVEVRTAGKGSFAILMNLGRFVQVFDNVLLNSEHWLVREIEAGRLSRGRIIVEVEAPKVRVFDNGRGIEPSVEQTLFEPFVTTKESGRGLGLFIVQQLLEPEGCTIRLLPERNESGRLFKFEIDFSGVMHAERK
jgi:signal transduction histidine kinase